MQTELEEKEYELLASIAKREGLTIKEAARKALLEWSLSGINLEDDPFFKLKPIRFRERIKNSEIDRYLYGARQ